MTKKIFAEEMLSDEMLDVVTGSAYIYYTSAASNDKSGLFIIKTEQPFANKLQAFGAFINAQQNQKFNADGSRVEANFRDDSGFISMENVHLYVAYHQAVGNQFVDVNTLP